MAVMFFNPPPIFRASLIRPVRNPSRSDQKNFEKEKKEEEEETTDSNIFFSFCVISITPNMSRLLIFYSKMRRLSTTDRNVFLSSG